MTFLLSIIPSRTFWAIIIIVGFIALYVAIVRDFLRMLKDRDIT
jgi:hypothetical protein